MSFEVRKILELPEGFSQLEVFAAAEGFNFLTKMKSAWLNQRNCFDQKGELLVAAFSEDGPIHYWSKSEPVEKIYADLKYILKSKLIYR